MSTKSQDSVGLSYPGGFRTLQAALLLIGLPGSSLLAQGRIIELGRPGTRTSRQIQSAPPSLETMRDDLELRIEEINRVCQLTEKQLKKLQVAAKGTIDVWTFEDHDKSGDDPRLGLAVNALAHAGLVQGDLARPIERIVIKQPENEAGRRALVDHPIWKDTVRRVLTREQHQRLERERELRRQYKIRAAIAKIVAAMDAQLLLSTDQRSQIADLVEQNYRPGGPVNWARQLVAIHELIDVHRIAQVFPSQSLQDILSDTQMKKWNALAPQEVRAQWIVR